MKTMPTQQPWMTPADYDRYCAFVLVADLCFEAMNTQDRPAWLKLCRIAKHISHGPWQFFGHARTSREKFSA